MRGEGPTRRGRVGMVRRRSARRTFAGFAPPRESGTRPRRLRLEYPQAIHQVMARGHARQHIVCHDTDRRKRVERLERTVTVHGWESFAYVLLSNHVHLLLRTPKPNRSRGMHAAAALRPRDRLALGAATPPVRSRLPGAVPRPGGRGRDLLLDRQPLPSTSTRSAPAWWLIPATGPGRATRATTIGVAVWAGSPTTPCWRRCKPGTGAGIRPPPIAAT